MGANIGACGSTAKWVAISLAILYVLIPAVLYLVPHIHVYIIFLHFVRWPLIDYSNPQQLGVQAASRNFYLDVDDGSVGVWQILPKDTKAASDADFDRSLSDARYPIIVYNHGNCWSRCAPHRTKLYNRLSEFGYHVIAFDYRGYGDSPGFPTEAGMIKDAATVYKWAMKRAGSNPVFIWGHSLGTAISAAVVDDLCAKDECPLGVILEAPFNNLREAVRNHFLSAAFRWIPWMDSFLVEPPLAYGLRLDTDERIKRIKCPVLIMHAKDDFVVPFHLGDKLHNVAKMAGVDVSFAGFDEHGHRYIVNAPQLAKLLSDFIDTSITKRSANQPPVKIEVEVEGELKEEIEIETMGEEANVGK